MPWAKGIVEWLEGDDAYLSVVFTWHMEEAWTRAKWLHHAGYRVHVGGPGTHVQTVPARKAIAEFAEVGGDIPDTVARHNPDATFASRGCPVGCWFCNVPSMEGRSFTLIPEFVPKPILCDNNLSALPADYQQYIVDRYRDAGVPLRDANSGFEPRTFDEEVYERWKPINRGPWRFACDDAGDAPYAYRVLDMLRDRVPNPRRKRVYTLIGNESFDACMERIAKVIELGGEPHAQPVMKLNAPTKAVWVNPKYDWTERLLKDVARWVNGRYWKIVPFSAYDRKAADCPAPGEQLRMEVLMPLHLLRGFVQWRNRDTGKDIKTIEDAEDWVKHIAELGFERFYTETTRRPVRADELKGGSVFFVGGPKRNQALFRMPFVEVEEYGGEGGMYGICMRPELIRVRQDFVGKVRGWRYLEDKDAPPDLPKVPLANSASDIMPPEMIADLKREGLL